MTKLGKVIFKRTPYGLAAVRIDAVDSEPRIIHGYGRTEAEAEEDLLKRAAESEQEKA